MTPTPRRFSPGESYEFDGIRFRIVIGSKTKFKKPEDDDLVLQWWAEGIGWVPVSMTAMFFMADFIFENENILYPPGRGFEGGGRFWRYLRHSMKQGWRMGHAGLEAEKAQRQLFPEDFGKDAA